VATARLFVDHVVGVRGPADQLSRGEPHADLVVGGVHRVGAVHNVAAQDTSDRGCENDVCGMQPRRAALAGALMRACQLPVVIRGVFHMVHSVGYLRVCIIQSDGGPLVGSSWRRRAGDAYRPTSMQ
jgi:hypothetical protein